MQLPGSETIATEEKLQLLEICFVCGFVHRDDRWGVRQSKLHYHFSIPTVPGAPTGLKAAGTICAGCANGGALEWTGARKLTASQYKSGGQHYNVAYPHSTHTLVPTSFQFYVRYFDAEVGS